MRIYTKFGDKGNTSLLGGTIVPKNDVHVEAYGAIDELNAMLGFVVASSDNDKIKLSMCQIQNDLFVLGTELASRGTHTKSINPIRISEIEAEIDNITADLPPLRNFILPGGSKLASMLHLARTVCRRAERAVVTLSQKEKINPTTIMYLNRVGDLFFMQARYVNYKNKVDEIIWKG